MNGVDIFLIVLAVAVVVGVIGEIWKMRGMSPQERAEYTAARHREIEARKRHPNRNRPISQVGVKGEGAAGLACPKCGGTQFKARRSNTKRVTLAATAAIATPLTRQNQVQCVTCGAKYARG